ncbi:hypothetical protein JYJ95_31780 [Corallococcus exiguus]|uniref:hypothetical protein n=1 Tax=Corallococcus exiguus TaxID=83462 RepID=UPI001A8CFB0E|nr:hypothetical protein [Corallococcus exiguus]MBN8471108.1 hypothetical protein [Corallococcus exiguus]
MRDSKRLMAVMVFLAAMPAWASDMCGLGGLLFLPPVYLWTPIAWILGLVVRKPRSARISMGVLVVLGLPALGAILLCLNGSFHGSLQASELHHPQMLSWSVGALVLLAASHGWSFWRLVTCLSK